MGTGKDSVTDIDIRGKVQRRQLKRRRRKKSKLPSISYIEMGENGQVSQGHIHRHDQRSKKV